MNKSLLILIFTVFSLLGSINLLGMSVNIVPKDHILIRTTILGLGTEIEYEERKRLLVLYPIHQLKKLPSEFEINNIKPTEEHKWLTNLGVEICTSLTLTLEVKKDKQLIKELVRELGIDGIKSKEWIQEYIAPLLPIVISRVSRNFSLADFKYRPEQILRKALELIPHTSQYIVVKEAKFLNIRNKKFEKLDVKIQNILNDRFT